MIKFGKKLLIINPHQLYDKESLEYAQFMHQTDSLKFIVPEQLESLVINDFKTHQIHMMYKVGFLTEVFRHLFPDYKSKDVFSLLYIEHQLFLSERTMRQNLTYWYKYRDKLIRN